MNSRFTSPRTHAFNSKSAAIERRIAASLAVNRAPVETARAPRRSASTESHQWPLGVLPPPGPVEPPGPLPFVPEPGPVVAPPVVPAPGPVMPLPVPVVPMPAPVPGPGLVPSFGSVGSVPEPMVLEPELFAPLGSLAGRSLPHAARAKLNTDIAAATCNRVICFLLSYPNVGDAFGARIAGRMPWLRLKFPVAQMSLEHVRLRMPWHERCTSPCTEMESRNDLLEKLALINRELQSSDAPTADLIEALADSARALNLPNDERKEDTFRFVEGDEAVESATWAQCGGLVQALEAGHIAAGRALAARVAARLFELVPTHYRVTSMPVLR